MIGMDLRKLLHAGSERGNGAFNGWHSKEVSRVTGGNIVRLEREDSRQVKMAVVLKRARLSG